MLPSLTVVVVSRKDILVFDTSCVNFNFIGGWILLACSKNSSSSLSLCIHFMSTSSINHFNIFYDVVVLHFRRLYDIRYTCICEWTQVGWYQTNFVLKEYHIQCFYWTIWRTSIELVLENLMFYERNCWILCVILIPVCVELSIYNKKKYTELFAIY